MNEWLSKIAEALPIVEERLTPLKDKGIVTRISFSGARWGFEPYRPTIRIWVRGTWQEWAEHAAEIQKSLADLDVGIDVSHADSGA